jgi:hypothetical protein
VAELLSLGDGAVPSDDEVDLEHAARDRRPRVRESLRDAMKVP